MVMMRILPGKNFNGFVLKVPAFIPKYVTFMFKFKLKFLTFDRAQKEEKGRAALCVATAALGPHFWVNRA